MTDANTLMPTDADIIALADKTRTGEPGRDGYILPISFARAVLAKWGSPAPASQPVAAPAGMQPVARIEGIDEYGPRLEWTQHWVDVGVGTKLYTAAQVQAMLAAAPRNAPLYSPDDVAFPIQRSADGADALPPELASIARPTSIAAAEATSAPIKAGEYPPLVCDYCGALTPDPWHSSGMLHGKMSKHIHSCDSCAVEAEVQKQDEALIRQMLEALECSGEPDDPGHRCSHCDDYVDRNSVLRNAARKRLEGKP